MSFPWWRHQMDTFSALLTICEGNAPFSSGYSSQRPVTRNFDVFFYLHLNKWLSKQSWRGWFETPSCSLGHHSKGLSFIPATAFVFDWITAFRLRTPVKSLLEALSYFTPRQLIPNLLFSTKYMANICVLGINTLRPWKKRPPVPAVQATSHCLYQWRLGYAYMGYLASMS